MTRDPFYNEIVSALTKRKLDPDAFERCAADLLRDTFPTLVPVRGGDDAGMDGAITDFKGEAFPLITTTSCDSLKNLKTSLKSYRRRGGPRRLAVFATSRSLTPRRRTNLQEAARKLGFTLVQLVDQAGFADRIYRRQEWCLELLNLTGRPSAVSLLPLSKRPHVSSELVGREADLSWLRNSTADLLICGQPGSGKTVLLREYAKKDEALFVVEPDFTRIANGIRSQRPNALIVDDAHMDPLFLTRLRRLRDEVGGTFKIVATCWPAARDAVADALGITDSMTRELDLLTQDEILAIIKANGIFGPDPLLHELLQQCAGRPGLATTLAMICLREGVSTIATGDALFRDVRSSLGALTGQRAVIVLAAFAVGGNRGMRMEVVAEQLSSSLLDVMTIANGLAAAGVIREVDKSTLAAHPPALQHALVRDVFFTGDVRLPDSVLEGLIADASGLEGPASALLGAAHRGARVPNELLRGLLKESNRVNLWRSYAALGERQASWILANRPESLLSIAEVALDLVPGEVIPLLLSSAANDKTVDFQSNRPLHELKDWIESSPHGSPSGIERKRQLIRSTIAWFEKGNCPTTTLQGLRLALSPYFEDRSVNPGSAGAITIRFGIRDGRELNQIGALWPVVMEFVRAHEFVNWRPIQELVADWSYARFYQKRPQKAAVKAKRSIARRMIKDLLPYIRGRQGLLRWAKGIARDLRLRISIRLDPEFELLFPLFKSPDERAELQELEPKIMALAFEYSRRHADDVAKQIASVEREGTSSPRLTPILCRALAEQVVDHAGWIEPMIEERLPGDLLAPFLQRLPTSEDEAVQLFKRCIDRPESRQMAIALALWIQPPPCEIVDYALQRLDGLAELIRIQCMLGRVADPNLPLLLDHGDAEVAAAAADGCWSATDERVVPAVIQNRWRAVVVHQLDKSYHLHEMFKRNPSIAMDWIYHRLRERRVCFWKCKDETASATRVLDKDQRRAILAEIDDDGALCDLVQLLVEEDVELYGFWLGIAKSDDLALAPLEGTPDATWIEKARLALASGYSTAQVAGALTGHRFSWTGNESEAWAGWAETYRVLCNHEDPGIKQVGMIGLTDMEAEQKRAFKRERDEAVYGREID